MHIEKYLVLNKYLLSLFNIKETKDLFNELKNKNEGVDSEGRSYFLNALRGIGNIKIPEEDLLRYDQNIQFYVRRISFRRNPINLKYFQYLAVLFTEIVLDNLKNRKNEFLHELNEFLETYKNEQDINPIENFSEEDLRKLAFWMATGAGKTLIMHINYHQFFNYRLFSPDNIILITPNEGLSKQHFEELQKSGIPCRLYTGSLNGGGLRSENEVLVIEMTKLVEEKKGRGVTLPVDAFEGRNLVFVDEGHKGRRSEEQKWARLRNKLAEDGFVFEYSATFGQILSESQPEIIQEYGKSIIFDYSYKYFYLDGYGKDFFILNVKESSASTQKFQECMFVANLLSFYEQILAYEENKNTAKEYNLEKPLWIFVGTTVTGKEEESDVILIVELIKKVLQDENWLKSYAKNILEGNTGLKDEDNKDVFQEKFKYLKNKGMDYEDLYRRVFGGRGILKLYELKNAEGEIGLKAGENEYFGVINIGNVSDFKKQLEKKGILVEQDVILSSLFDKIKKEDSKINILIGSKKFIEGWDTWRVSSMGLLNIGRGQGPQIIQLFGRGVRLKGKEMSLKRSGENSWVKILETLNIYGIKADYLNKFLEAISKEEVEFETIEIPVIPQCEEKLKTLSILTKDEKKRFEEEGVLRFELDNRIYFTIDLLPKVSVYQAKENTEEGIKKEQIRAEAQEMRMQGDIIELFNWDKIWKEIWDFKIMKGYWNLVLERERLKGLLLSDRYKILALPEIFIVKTKDDIARLEDIALLVIKKYIDLFYRKYAKRFETDNLQYVAITDKKQLLLPFVSEKGENYVLQIKKKDEEGRYINKDLIDKIKKLKKDLNKLLKEESDELPRVYFASHLYLPILCQNDKIDRISPEGLVKSEVEFVKQLREYLKINKEKFGSYDIFLLRNFPKSGVGFQLQWSGFYPDFIMWIKKDKKQIIVFIDPKGLEHSKGLDDEKIIFAGFKPQNSDAITIKDIQNKLGNGNIVLESFILSITPYEELIKGMTSPPSKEEYEERHVLFLEDSDWPNQLLSTLYELL